MFCLLCLMLGGDARAHSGALGVRDPENIQRLLKCEPRREMLWLSLIILLVPGKWGKLYSAHGVCSAPFAQYFIWFCLLRLMFSDVQIDSKIHYICWFRDLNIFCGLVSVCMKFKLQIYWFNLFTNFIAHNIFRKWRSKNYLRGKSISKYTDVFIKSNSLH